MSPVKNPLIRRYFEVLLLNLSVEFVIRAEKTKIENKHMTAMFAAFQLVVVVFIFNMVRHLNNQSI